MSAKKRKRAQPNVRVSRLIHVVNWGTCGRFQLDSCSHEITSPEVSFGTDSFRSLIILSYRPARGRFMDYVAQHSSYSREQTVDCSETLPNI
jgi:hypothetical protein